VARAATTGGGRTAGQKRPLGWYSTMGVVVLIGLSLTWFSRTQELSKNQTAAKIPPRLNIDHWHSAFSVYLCDHWTPNIPQFESVDGIHTHGDGVIHVHPYTAAASGNGATLGFYVKAISTLGGHGKFKLSLTELQYPGDKTDWKNGDKCQGQPGKVKFTVNGKAQTTDPNLWRLRNGDYIDVGFVPDNTPLPSNPAEKANLAAITDVTPTGTTTPTTVAGAAPAATTGGATATTTAGAAPTTVAGGAPTTVAAAPAATAPGSPPTTAK